MLFLPFHISVSERLNNIVIVCDLNELLNNNIFNPLFGCAFFVTLFESPVITGIVMVSLQRPDILPPDIAWAMVSDRIYGDGSHLYDIEDVFPPLIAKVIETIGWSSLCDMSHGQYAGYYNGQDKQTFMELYKPAYERERERAMLPQSLRSDVEKAERIIGKDTQKYLDSARESRKKQEALFDTFLGLPPKVIEIAEKQRMIGESNHE